MRQTIDTLGELSEESLSDEARERLTVAFRGWAAGPQGPMELRPIERYSDAPWPGGPF